jgi:hypothetical protein
MRATRRNFRHAADQEAGLAPAPSRMKARIEVVVVLPCVPATASVRRPGSTLSRSHSAPEV